MLIRVTPVEHEVPILGESIIYYYRIIFNLNLPISYSRYLFILLCFLELCLSDEDFSDDDHKNISSRPVIRENKELNEAAKRNSMS